MLSNGVKIPSIGFGTWQIPNGEIACNAVTFALQNGYRLIDTAHTYGNEQSVGRAILDSGINRSEIFVTSKLPADIKNYKDAAESFNKTLEALGLTYIDLYLIHAPWPWKRKGYDYSEQNSDVWKAMEEVYKSGSCRAIGVSNFGISDLKAILKNCSVKPMVNQISYFVGNTQKELTYFCQQNDILVEGYSPLATGAVLNNKHVLAIAEKYKTTLPKICIRYVLQKGVVPLPKSINPEHIKQNFDIDFEIAPKDMEYLDSLNSTIKGMQLSKIKGCLRKWMIAIDVTLQKMNILPRQK